MSAMSGTKTYKKNFERDASDSAAWIRLFAMIYYLENGQVITDVALHKMYCRHNPHKSIEFVRYWARKIFD